MRDINNDLTSMDQEVDRVYTRVQTARSIKERSMKKEPPPPKRNYHEPVDKEEIKRSFSPRRRGPSDDEYDDNRYEDDFNDRAAHKDQDQMMMHSGGAYNGRGYSNERPPPYVPPHQKQVSFSSAMK